MFSYMSMPPVLIVFIVYILYTYSLFCIYKMCSNMILGGDRVGSNLLIVEATKVAYHCIQQVF